MRERPSRRLSSTNVSLPPTDVRLQPDTKKGWMENSYDKNISAVSFPGCNALLTMSQAVLSFVVARTCFWLQSRGFGDVLSHFLGTLS